MGLPVTNSTNGIALQILGGTVEAQRLAREPVVFRGAASTDAAPAVRFATPSEAGEDAIYSRPTPNPSAGAEPGLPAATPPTNTPAAAGNAAPSPAGNEGRSPGSTGRDPAGPSASNSGNGNGVAQGNGGGLLGLLGLS